MCALHRSSPLNGRGRDPFTVRVRAVLRAERVVGRIPVHSTQSPLRPDPPLPACSPPLFRLFRYVPRRCLASAQPVPRLCLSCFPPISRLFPSCFPPVPSCLFFSCGASSASVFGPTHLCLIWRLCFDADPPMFSSVRLSQAALGRFLLPRRLSTGKVSTCNSRARRKFRRRRSARAFPSRDGVNEENRRGTEPRGCRQETSFY